MQLLQNSNNSFGVKLFYNLIETYPVLIELNQSLSQNLNVIPKFRNLNPNFINFNQNSGLNLNQNLNSFINSSNINQNIYNNINNGKNNQR